MIAVLEYHDLEEYVGLDWKDKDVPEKTAFDPNKVLQHKEMKKCKAILVWGTNDLPNMLVKEAKTPYAALDYLREKYAVKKVQEDFKALDIEWNNYKVTNSSTDPDLVFKTLEEQSRRLGIFGERYSKDELQMLSKLQHTLPKEYDHIFTFLNTNKEQIKSSKEQLENTKVMIQSHCKTNIVNTSKDNTMIFMLTGTNDTNKQTNDTYCDVCKKYGHPKMKKGKPYYFKYKKKLKKETKKDKTDDLDNINNMFVNCITTS